MKSNQIIWLGIIALAATAWPAAILHAQSYSIDWFKVAGGGATSTGGVYSASGTIGQHDAGTMIGGGYSLDSGFWSLIGAVQTPGAPLLSIQLTSTNSVIVSWPSSATGFTLQQNNNVAVPNWVAVTNSVSLNGGQSQVIVSPPTGRQFYRLKYP